jgi:hypothetical protein
MGEHIQTQVISSFRVPECYYKQVVDIASREGNSVSSVLRRLIIMGLRNGSI